MWKVQPSSRWNWESLKESVRQHGVRNSLLIAPMPTASTAQILGNNESIEPCTSNIYSRRVLSGEFQVVNKHLLRELTERGLWNDDMRMQLIANMGSVQTIFGIPKEIKRIYRTVWEISQKSIIEMAADRAPFICQSQSLNIHIAQPTYAKISSMHFYGWKTGMKTGMYYLRSKPAAAAIQFTVDQTKLTASKQVPKSPEPLKRQTSNQSSSGLAKMGSLKTELPAVAGDEGNTSEAQKENRPIEADSLVPQEEAAATPQLTEEEQARLLCSLENKEACMMCSG